MDVGDTPMMVAESNDTKHRLNPIPRSRLDDDRRECAEPNDENCS